MPNNSLQKAIQVLKEEGYIEADISKIVADWGKVAFSRLYSEMMLAFTDKEIQELEKIEDKQKMAEEVKRRFKEKTQKDPDILSQEYLDIIASQFLASRERENLKTD